MHEIHPWLSRYAKLVVLATLGLIFLGGMVTSTNAGLSVPDWPTSYGYNMFTFPISRWVGGVFFEHTHRLFASGVGLLTTILAIWIWKVETRKSVRNLGVGAFFLVAVQGVLGGLRVTELSVALAIVHACTAQAFLCILVVLATALSPRWIAGKWECSVRTLPAVSRLGWILVAMVYLQLILGAVTRHMRAGLAIGDFPLAFGHLIPPMWSPQIAIHYSHRIGGLCVFFLALALMICVLTYFRNDRDFVLPAVGIMILVFFQIALGAHIIWLAKAPVVTTLHVVNGAIILGTSLLLAMRISHLNLSDVRSQVFDEAHSVQQSMV